MPPFLIINTWHFRRMCHNVLGMLHTLGESEEGKYLYPTVLDLHLVFSPAKSTLAWMIVFFAVCLIPLETPTALKQVRYCHLLRTSSLRQVLGFCSFVMLLPPTCCVFWSIQHNFHVCSLSFSSFWPSSLLLLSPRAWLWPGSAFQFCPLCRCGIWHAHHFCIQSHCSVHLCWGQDQREEVGQLFSTLQLQGKTEHVAITMVTLHTLLSWKVRADK